MRRAVVLGALIAFCGGGTAYLVLDRGYEIAPPASIEVSSWERHEDASAGWVLRYPESWHLQTEEDREWGNSVVVVTNVGGDLVHPDLGPRSSTALWDMRELPRGFVVVQLEEPADVPPGPRGSQRTLPLSLDDARRGAGAARFGVPPGLRFPVYFDDEHSYVVRVWFGPEATRHDRQIAERIVASIRFELD